MSEKNYQKFSKETDFSDLDHIIVGSGIGGLTAAVWLAKAGKKVAVFERHYVPGGLTHTFKRKKGFEWDVGVHYVGNMENGNYLQNLFNFITDNELEWDSMGDIYDIVHIGEDQYKFKAGKQNFIKELTAYFPDEKEAIQKYIDLIEKVAKRGSGFFFEKSLKPLMSKTVGSILRNRFNRYAQKTTAEVLDSLTDNTRLKAVLAGQCGNYGLTPRDSSFGAHAIVVNHFLNGGFYPRGGADQIWKTIIKNIVKHDGQVFVKADVQKIVVEKNRTKGVIIDDHFIACKSVISNVGANNTFNHLLTNTERTKSRFNLESVAPSSGHMCLYVGLDQSDETLNLPKNNIWYFDNEDLDGNVDGLTLNSAAENFAYISFPSSKDSEWQNKNPGTATIQALTVGRYDWVRQYENTEWMNRGPEYDRLKVDFKETMLKRIYALCPQIEGHVVEVEVSSPLSTKHFTNYQHGEIYGLAHTPQRFKLPFLRTETKIKGLRLVGQDITIVGLASGMVSGMLGAITILKWRCWKHFKSVAKNHSKEA